MSFGINPAEIIVVPSLKTGGCVMTCKVCGYRISVEGEQCPKCRGRVVDLDASQEDPESAQTLVMNLADAVAALNDKEARKVSTPAQRVATVAPKAAAPKPDAPGRIAGRPGVSAPVRRARRVMPDTVFGLRRLDVDVTKQKREEPKIVPQKQEQASRVQFRPWHGILFFLLVGLPSIAYVIWILTHAHG
jgi:hypothetical protein